MRDNADIIHEWLIGGFRRDVRALRLSLPMVSADLASKVLEEILAWWVFGRVPTSGIPRL
ncbi:hypothetical protein [Nitratireductor aquibiodomus]|uniref:hypothetical protein n=1 Tax=Nitratireductor aquibiodomus TaxID=204799 RepID=UPI00030FDF43